MRNFKKLLCVVLALVVALTAASCSLSKQYAYRDNDVELPIGVYIYYLYSAYSQAQSYAQQSDKYDSTTGRYDGKKSFLKMEITDSDGNTAVAEDWIKDKAKELTLNAVAVSYEYKRLGATIDEMSPDDMYSNINIYSVYNSQTGQLDYSLDQKISEVAKNYEQFGIGFDSWLLCSYSLGAMEEAAFDLEYAADGGETPVTKEEITNYFTENYTSYSTISANLYTEETVASEDGSESEETQNVAMSESDIKKYEDAFKNYAKELSDGKSMDDVVEEYNKEFNAEATASPNVAKIDKDTEDELNKAILALKEGEASYKIIGDDETTRVIYLIYRAPIKDKVSEYVDDETKRDSLLHEMKDEEFEELIKNLIEDKGFKLSGDCNGYQPSLFEKTKK